MVGGIGNFAGKIFFLLGGWNLRRSDFDHLNLFKAKNNLKKTSINIEQHGLKSKLP